MSEVSTAFVNFFTSLRLTVVLLVMSMILVFGATIAQIDLGVWGVQQQYFRTFFVLTRVPGTDIPIPVYPGGYLIGGMMMINLIASHVYRFKFTWKKAGIQLTHFGLILLLIGELVSSLFQEEYSLHLDKDSPRNYSESFRDFEVAILDTTNPDFDDVVAIPESLLKTDATIQQAKLPFQVVVKGFYPSANLAMLTAMPSGAATAGLAPNPSTRDIGPRLAVMPIRPTSKDNERNQPTAMIELIGTEGSLGTWLVSPMLQPQGFDYAGRSFKLVCRLARTYKPFSLTLLELRHDVYPGSNIPKNFSSRVRVKSDDGVDDRESLIYMNNPLRYQGFTFYQFQMNADNGFSVLQVVRNPGYTIPYVACIIMGVGLLWQFLLHLTGFVRRRR